MLQTQRFALEHIYCAPTIDRQHTFSLVRMTKKNFPVKRSAKIYQVDKPLPDTDNFYHVYVIGNFSPHFLNLIRQQRDWFRDSWINVENDMNQRNLIVQLYNELGVMCPRKYIYYSFIDENSLCIAVQQTQQNKHLFDMESFKFLRLYSCEYFKTPSFSDNPSNVGIYCESKVVNNNVEKVQLQTKITELESNGGKTLVYLNGYLSDVVSLEMPNHSCIEILYDQSIISKEVFPINDLRTFESTLDNKLKYLLYRQKIIDTIQYEDDNELYIVDATGYYQQGTFYYEHKEYAARNVTDKDYSLYTTFVNNQASALSEQFGGAIQDKTIVLYTRRSGYNRNLIYSQLKLHELYKLPFEVAKDILSNMNYTITELRAETLEASHYFQIARAKKLSHITETLAYQALGYSAITKYFGDTPVSVEANMNTVDVPSIYSQHSTAFEYDVNGIYLENHITDGSLYTTTNPLTKSVNFIYGNAPSDHGSYYEPGDTIELKEGEYYVIAAHFDGIQRLSTWVDVTNNIEYYTLINNTVTITASTGYKVKIIYLLEPNIYDLNIPMTDGVLHFPLTIKEDRGLGIQLQTLDRPYSNIEIFLNGNRLVYGIDWNMSFPYVTICNKTYLKYSSEDQWIHVRMYGRADKIENINQTEINGFVTHGVLGRNNAYDITDDKVLIPYIDGKLYDRSLIHYAESDNVVRTAHPFNGKPYSLCEPYISIKATSGKDTYEAYIDNIDLNKRLSDLFNIVFSEPSVPEFNVISDHHYLYSPTVSKIIQDMLDGNIAETIYTRPYDHQTIVDLIDSRYREIYKNDPIKKNLPSNIVEIHPHIGNDTIQLNLFQYRFLTNIVNILTDFNPDRINLSGYIALGSV